MLMAVLRFSFDVFVESDLSFVVRETLRRSIFGLCIASASICVLIKIVAERRNSQNLMDFISRYVDYFGYFILSMMFSFSFFFYIVEMR